MLATNLFCLRVVLITASPPPSTSGFSIVFSFFALKKFKEKLDPRKFNGAIFLGLKGPVVKSHGSTDAIGFYHSIDLCYRIIKGDLMNKIKNNLSHINEDNK